MNEPPLPAPYRGLTAYTEDDASVFFGRKPECEIITANLLAARLTLLYGASGVGKSSVLRAGVAHHLRRHSQQNLIELGTPKLAVAVFDSWRDDPTVGLLERVESAVVQAWNGRTVAPVRPEPTLAQTLHAWAERVDGDLLIILDQFEEYFLYHAQYIEQETFVIEFARAVDRLDLRANFLIALREDSLAKLDRFKGHIPRLFDNYLRIDHLDYESARAAIEEPLAHYNQRHTVSAYQVSIEAALVDEILEQVKTGQVVLDNAGRGKIGGRDALAGPEARVETPYLQLVLMRLWDEEMRAGSRTMRLATLEDLGGARRIVRTHLDMAMSAMSLREQDVAARTFHHLVTPSGTKIAYTVDDLAAYASVQQKDLIPVLEQLASRSSRILRPVSPPSDQSATPRYEIFHDVLAPAILDWRARYLRAEAARVEHERHQRALQQARDAADEQRRQAEAERRRAEAQTAIARRLRTRSILMAILSLVAVGTAALAIVELKKADQQTRIATGGELAAQALTHLGDQYDLALLLAVEAGRLDNTVQAKSSLLAALQSNLHLTSYLRGHTGRVESVAFSPDGRTLASGGDDGTVRLWDVAAASPRRAHLTIGSTQVLSVAFSPDGQTLASGGRDGSVTLWNMATYRRSGSVLFGHRGAVTSLSFSPDGHIVASGSRDNTVILWDVTTHHRLGPQLTGHTRAVTSVAFSPDGRLLAAGSEDRTVILWDVRTYRRVGQPLNGHQREVYALAFSPNSRVLATGGWTRTIILWDVSTHQRIGQPLVGHTSAVTSLAFSPDARRLVSGSDDATLHVWNIGTHQSIGPPLTGHTGIVTSVAFSPDDRTLASGSVDGTCILWDITIHPRIGQPIAALHGQIHSIAFSADGKTLAIGGDDRKIRLWDVGMHRPLGAPLIGHTGRVFGVAFSPNGRILVSGSDDGTLRLWNVATHRQLGAPITGPMDIVHSVAFSPEGGIVASGNWDQTVTLWNVATHRRIGLPLIGHTSRVWSVTFSPDGKTLASASYDKTVMLWNIATHRRIDPPLIGHTLPVFTARFSPDGRMLASGSWDGTIRLWNVATHRLAAPPLTGHTDSVIAVAFNPDGRTLASGSQDKTIIFWDVATGERVGPPLTGPTGAIYSVAFSPDGRLLTSAGADGKVWLWDADGESWVRRACGIANRNLTDEEWNTYIGHSIAYERVCPNVPIGQ